MTKEELIKKMVECLIVTRSSLIDEINVDIKYCYHNTIEMGEKPSPSFVKKIEELNNRLENIEQVLIEAEKMEVVL